MVCISCGSTVAESRSRGWVHTEEIPRTSKAHDAVPVPLEDYQRIKTTEAVLEPLNEARAYARTMQDQMNREEMAGVKWDDAARHAVILFVALEAIERELLLRVASGD